MSEWKLLELNRPEGRPKADQLVAIRLIPNNERPAFYYRDAKYDIGRFDTENEKSRKLWWHGTHGLQDPIKMKRHYCIWWCHVTDFYDD